MARSAPATCGTCGFYLQLAGSLRAAFGVCGNEISPADGHVVHAEFGCGAHSEVEIETSSSVPVAELVYDDSLLDVEPTTDPASDTEAEANSETTESPTTGAEESVPSEESAETATSETPDETTESATKRTDTESNPNA